MSRSEILGKAAAGLGAVAVPVVFAVAGSGQASADPGWCVSGPFGYASACLNVPVWGGWNVWNGGWDNGRHDGWHEGRHGGEGGDD
jgi:hypothetical protein